MARISDVTLWQRNVERETRRERQVVPVESN